MFEASRIKGGKDAVWYAPGSMYCFPSTLFHLLITVASSEASNCGGVAVSGLEMAQNSARLKWTREEVDAKLKGIMTDCYKVFPLMLHPQDSIY